MKTWIPEIKRPVISGNDELKRQKHLLERGEDKSMLLILSLT